MKKREMGKKGLLGLLFWRMAARYKETVVKMGKIQAAKTYVQVVDRLRTSSLLAVSIAFCIVLMLAGIVFLHAAIILLSGWTLCGAGIFLLASGLIHLIGAGAVLLRLMSSKSWANYFNVEEVTERALK